MAGHPSAAKDPQGVGASRIFDKRFAPPMKSSKYPLSRHLAFWQISMLVWTSATGRVGTGGADAQATANAVTANPATPAARRWPTGFSPDRRIPLVTIVSLSAA